MDIDGNTAVLGAFFRDDAGSASGAAYVFVRSGTTWTQQQRLNASDAAAGDMFGNAVAVSGNTLIVGAYLDEGSGAGSGSAYVFRRSGTTWTQQSKITASDEGAGDRFGSNVDLSENTAVIGANIGDSAGTDDTGSAYVFGTVYDEGDALTDLSTLSSLTVQAGQVVALSVSPINELDVENLDMPSVVYTWNAGGCGTLSSTTSRTPIFTASSSGCSGSITVHASQGGGSQVPSSDLSISITVKSPPAPAAPTAVPVDPTVVPVIVPAGLTADDVSVILPSTGGAFSIPQAAGDTGAPIAISIPGGAIDSGTAFAVNIVVVSSDDVPPPPEAATEGFSSNTFKFGSTIIDIRWFDESGTELSPFKLNKPAQICVPFVQSDIDGAEGGPDGLSIWRYNGTEWVELNSTVNISNGTVCASSSNFSFFALGLAVAPPSEEVVVPVDPAILPVTGDYAPSTLTLLFAMFSGVGLIATGVVALRRVRNPRPAR